MVDSFERTDEGSVNVKMEELDCGVVFVEDWINSELLGQEQVIVAEQLTNMDGDGMETYFIEVADASVADVSMKTEDTHKRRKKKKSQIDVGADDVDLSWLIGFKLDGLIKNNVLDDWPNADAKKSNDFRQFKFFFIVLIFR